MNDKKQTKQIAVVMRGQTFRNSKTDAAIPIQHTSSSAWSVERIQKTVDANHSLSSPYTEWLMASK